MNWHAHPVEIRYEEDEDLLHIKFSDGVEHSYETRILRGYCPSAVYQGHGSRPLKWTEPQSEEQITIADISQVGNYAICIAWEDGHNKGVYSFQMLRRFAEEPEELLEDYPPDE